MAGGPGYAELSAAEQNIDEGLRFNAAALTSAEQIEPAGNRGLTEASDAALAAESGTATLEQIRGHLLAAQKLGETLLGQTKSVDVHGDLATLALTVLGTASAETGKAELATAQSAEKGVLHMQNAGGKVKAGIARVRAAAAETEARGATRDAQDAHIAKLTRAGSIIDEAATDAKAGWMTAQGTSEIAAALAGTTTEINMGGRVGNYSEKVGVPATKFVTALGELATAAGALHKTSSEVAPTLRIPATTEATIKSGMASATAGTKATRPSLANSDEKLKTALASL